MYRVCIISCGMIANSAHIPAYNNFPDDFEIIGVCDTNPEAAMGTAKRHGVKNYYTDAEKMLDELRPDVVSVCVPNFLHKKMTMLSLLHGCNVICEKPLAYTVSDAIEMFSLAKSKGVTLMACQSMRFTPDRLAAKKLIDDGKMGRIYYGEFSRIRRRGIPTWGTFHIRKFSAGGAFLDLGVHMLDAIVWLTGNPKLRSVCATMGKYHADEIGTLTESGARTGKVHIIRKFTSEEMDVEDFSSGSLLFENDIRINFTVAWAANMPEASDIRIIGKNTGIYLPECKVFSGIDKEKNIPEEELRYKNEAFPGHFYIMDNLRKVLKGKELPIVTPEETINVTRIIENVYKSARIGKEIIVSD